MDWDGVLSVLKWVGLAFAAGFIGYFGKYLGRRIIARFSKAKEDKPTTAEPPIPAKEKPDYKLEKKRLKLEKKRLKKQKK